MSHSILRAALALTLAFGLTAAACAGDYRDQSYTPPSSEEGGDSDTEGLPPTTHPLTKVAVDYECLYMNGTVYFNNLTSANIVKGTIIKVKMPDGTYKSWSLGFDIYPNHVFGIPGFFYSGAPAWDCENAVGFYVG